MVTCSHFLSFDQANLITEYATVVQPVQVAFQQQMQNLKTQHEEFVNSLTQQQQQQIPIPPLENEVKSTPPPQAPSAAPASAPPSAPVTQAGADPAWPWARIGGGAVRWGGFAPFSVARCRAGLAQAKGRNWRLAAGAVWCLNIKRTKEINFKRMRHPLSQ